MSSAVLSVVIDLAAITILAVGLYYRRHHRRDLMFAYLTLNVGVLAVTAVLGGAQAGIGLGLGLFGVLSIIRLRSDPISQAEIAYYFCALALGLMAGLSASAAIGAWWMLPAFSALLLLVVVVADHPAVGRGTRHLHLTLDVAIVDRSSLAARVAGTVGGRVTRLEVVDVDLVRDVTVVDVWFVPEGLPAGRRSGVAPAPVPMGTAS